MKAKSPKGRIIAYLGDWCEKYGCKSPNASVLFCLVLTGNRVADETSPTVISFNPSGWKEDGLKGNPPHLDQWYNSPLMSGASGFSLDKASEVCDADNPFLFGKLSFPRLLDLCNQSQRIIKKIESLNPAWKADWTRHLKMKCSDFYAAMLEFRDRAFDQIRCAGQGRKWELDEKTTAVFRMDGSTEYEVSETFETGDDYFLITYDMELLFFKDGRIKWKAVFGNKSGRFLFSERSIVHSCVESHPSSATLMDCGILVGLTAGKEYPVLSRTDFDGKNYLTIVNDFGKEMSINSTRMKVFHEEVYG